MFIARPDDRVPFGGNELRLQPDAREFFHEPICTLLQLFLVLIISRNTWKSQKRIELLKILFTHSSKSKSSLPQTSNTQKASRTHCRAGASPARPASGALALQKDGRTHAFAR